VKVFCRFNYDNLKHMPDELRERTKATSRKQICVFFESHKGSEPLSHVDPVEA
jgi:hypothetical protein